MPTSRPANETSPLLSQTATGRRPEGKPRESQPEGGRRFTSQPDRRPTERYEPQLAPTGTSHTSRRFSWRGGDASSLVDPRSVRPLNRLRPARPRSLRSLPVQLLAVKPPAASRVGIRCRRAAAAPDAGGGAERHARSVPSCVTQEGVNVSRSCRSPRAKSHDMVAAVCARSWPSPTPSSFDEPARAAQQGGGGLALARTPASCGGPPHGRVRTGTLRRIRPAVAARRGGILHA